MKAWRLYFVAGSAATLVVHFVAGLGWGLSAFASLVGWPLLGTAITADDDLPGGWSNPDGTERPAWRTTLFWGQLSMGTALSAFVAALDAGIVTIEGVEFVLAGFAAGIVAGALLRKN